MIVIIDKCFLKMEVVKIVQILPELRMMANNVMLINVMIFRNLYKTVHVQIVIHTPNPPKIKCHVYLTHVIKNRFSLNKVQNKVSVRIAQIILTQITNERNAYLIHAPPEKYS